MSILSFTSTFQTFQVFLPSILCPVRCIQAALVVRAEINYKSVWTFCAVFLTRTEYQTVDLRACFKLQAPFGRAYREPQSLTRFITHIVWIHLKMICNKHRRYLRRSERNCLIFSALVQHWWWNVLLINYKWNYGNWNFKDTVDVSMNRFYWQCLQYMYLWTRLHL